MYLEKAQFRRRGVERSKPNFSASKKMLSGLLGIAIGCVVSPGVAVADSDSESERKPNLNLETVTIVASEPDRLARTPGAVNVIDNAQLEQFAYADIQRALRYTPGIALQVEDGFGLRPNISIRGVASERSGRITLLEDNVLIAPAPYSAPSAYYFPTPGRMHSIEVLKGPSAISQGPYTIGGTLNLVSTPIPSATEGYAKAHIGEHSSNRLHVWQSFVNDNGLSSLLEMHQWSSNGYQTIDRSDMDTGLQVRDYTVKLHYEPVSNHRFEFKFQIADQTSQQSYLGLTDFHFEMDPLRRYGISELDEIETSHRQGILTYFAEVSDATEFRVSAYRNTHERTWFKTEGIDFDGSDSAESLSRTSWSNVIRAVNLGQGIGDTAWSDLNGILLGTVDTAPGSIQLRSNAREYFSHGVQVWFVHQLQLGQANHFFEASLRVHEDEEDRLQRNSSYRQESGKLVLDDLGLLGNAGNRIQEAKAIALYIKDTVELGNVTLTPGIRFEHIEQHRTRYEIRPGRTSDPASRAASNLRSTRENLTKVWSPGIGASYRLSDSMIVHGGVHKGFTAPSNAPGVKEESAWIYETGIRYVHASAPFSANLVGFLTDYDNLLGECTASSGSDCEIGTAFNGDAATVVGLEVELTTDIAESREFSLPLNFNLTLLDGEFDTDIADTDFFGDVHAGDPIPYLPRSQYHLSMGYVKQPFEAFVSFNGVGETCVRASCQAYESIERIFTADVAGNYAINDSIALFARIENLLDEDSIVSRHPYGARPNKARTISFGATMNW